MIMYPLKHGEGNSMESNMPAVGGEEPISDVSQNTDSHVESTNGTSAPTLPAPDPQPSAPADVIAAAVAQPEMNSANEPKPGEAANAETRASANTSANSSSESGTTTQTEQPESTPGSDSMQTLLDQQSDEPQVKKGDILEGTVAQTTPTEILVDVGLKSEGIISGKELERMDHDTLDRLKVGEKVLAYVLNPEDKNGNVVLSLSRALEEQDWRQAESLHQSGEVYAGKIDGYNKGGLIVRFGRVRGFVPESQVSRDRRRRAEGGDAQEKWSGMRGEDIAVKVLEVDRARNRLILSERDAAPQIREQQKDRLMGELQVGDVRTGHVKSLADFGAFVDVGGADGLVHLTELSWKHVTHPRDVLEVGQEVEVEVISVDRDRKRIGLSIKRREEDPWMVIARQYQIGQLVEGLIMKLTKFGAFARLVDNPEIEGLVHISELADHRVNHPKEVVNEGESLALRVVKIEPEQRRMGLSLKRVSSPEYVDADFGRATTPRPAEPEPAATVGDYVDYEAAQIKDEDRRRNQRKKAKKGAKKHKAEFSEFGGEENDSY